MKMKTSYLNQNISITHRSAEYRVVGTMYVFHILHKHITYSILFNQTDQIGHKLDWVDQLNGGLIGSIGLFNSIELINSIGVVSSFGLSAHLN